MLISARLLWMATTQEEADSANEKMLERLDAKTLDEFWLGKQEVQDEDNEEPSEGETSECESGCSGRGARRPSRQLITLSIRTKYVMI